MIECKKTLDTIIGENQSAAIKIEQFNKLFLLSMCQIN